MKYLLDTNVCIEYLNNRQSPIAARLARVAANDVALCAVVKAELFFGVARCRNPEAARAKMFEFMSEFVSFPFDDAAAETCGMLRTNLAAAGMPIGPYDLQIAAIALSRGLTLVTHNTREFARIDGLQWEDWETPL